MRKKVSPPPPNQKTGQNEPFLGNYQKTRFKIFDYFANCEYFEEKFNYDEALKLPKLSDKDYSETDQNRPDPFLLEFYNSNSDDKLKSLNQTEIGPNGMKIDRMYFDRFEQTIINNPQIDELKQQANEGKWDELQDFIIHNVFEKPEDYFNVEKLRIALNVDRRIQLKEMLEKVFGLIPRFKTKEELLEEEFDKFDSRFMPGENYFADAKTIFKAYIEELEFRNIIDQKNYAQLNVTPWISSYHQLTPELRKLIPEYIKDYVPLNNFVV